MQKSAIEILNDIKSDLMNKKQYEYDCKSDDGFSIYLFWHSPSLNLGVYPIIQIDYNDKTIFNHEGTENPDCWYMLADKAIQKIKSKKEL